jgi:hypothetical protein
MVLAPGLVDLAVETIRRFVIVARNAGCSFVHTRLDDELATAANAEEIIAHVRDAVGRVPGAAGATPVSITHPRPGVPATPSPV